MNNISFKNDILPLKNSLYRLALRITFSAEESEDIVQETLIKVWNKRGEWDDIESIEAFCFTICRNLALDSVKRKENNNDSLEDAPIEQPDDNSNPLENAQQKDKIEFVKQILNSLPEKQRSCMQLRDFEGRPYKQIAKILGITEEQVKVNIFRARQAVKERYQKIDNYGL